MYEILWFQDAVDELFDLSRRDSSQARRILIAVRTFGRDGRGDVKKLQGSGDEWRLRTGDWRVRLALHDSSAYVVSIANRRDAY